MRGGNPEGAVESPTTLNTAAAPAPAAPTPARAEPLWDRLRANIQSPITSIQQGYNDWRAERNDPNLRKNNKEKFRNNNKNAKGNVPWNIEARAKLGIYGGASGKVRPQKTKATKPKVAAPKKKSLPKK